MADAVGLYLGTHSLHLVQISGGFGRPHVVKSESVELPAPTTLDVNGVARWQDPLKHLLRQARLAAPDVHAGIGAEATIIRYFQMPKLPSRDQATAIRFEAKKYLPFKLDELASDFHTVILRNDPQIMRVMFYAAKKDFVARSMHVLEDSGVHLASLESSLSSVTRLLRRARRLDANQTVVLVVIDHTTASIALVRGDLVYLARNVVTVAQAATEHPAPPATIHEALLNETVVSLDYYRRRFTGEPAVTKAFTCGDVASAAWAKDLGAALELPVEVIDAGQGLPGAPRLTGNAAVAFGLALKHVDPSPASINLAAADHQPEPVNLWQLAAVDTVAALVILGLLYAVTSQPLRALTTQLATMQQPAQPNALDSLPADAPVDRLRQFQTDREGELKFLRSFVAVGTPVAALINDMAAATPEEVWLRSMTHDDTYATTSAQEAIRSQRRLALIGAAYSPQKPRELDAIHRYLEALNALAAQRHTADQFTLTTVKRSVVLSNDVTEFNLRSEPRPPERNP